ncbi:MAG TPA: hypothetical protein VKV02_13860, partial [Acidobacteriaceae bacterium]|nr:hypothetical protein [Acidobacteriaceae bacterium]
MPARLPVALLASALLCPTHAVAQHTGTATGAQQPASNPSVPQPINEPGTPPAVPTTLFPHSET